MFNTSHFNNETSTSFPTNFSTNSTSFLETTKADRIKYSFNTIDVTFHQFFNYYFTVFFLLVGMVTNCIIVVVMHTPELRKLPLAVYFSALAISDTIVLVFASLGQFVKQTTGRSVFSYTQYCSSTAYLLTSAIGTSNWIVVCIACERFLVVAFPMKAKRCTSKTKAICAVIIIAATSFITHLTNIFMVDFKQPNCQYLPQYRNYYYKYRGMLNMMGLYFTPLGIICVAYLAMLYMLKKRNTVAPYPSFGIIKQKKLTATSMYICLAFLIFTSPLALYNLLALKSGWAWNKERGNMMFSSVAHSIRLINYSTNLFIYMATHTQFREITLRLFKHQQTQSVNTLSS